MKPNTSVKRRSIVFALLLLIACGAIGAPVGEQPRSDHSSPGHRSSPLAVTALSSIGGGEMVVMTPGGAVPLPILDLQVDIRATGPLVRGRLTQAFANPFTDPIEAVYVFPLPERAAVDELEIQVGDRRIVGVIEEKAAARRIYEQARAEGKKASLLEQHDGKLFKTRVANIGPGESIVVELGYFEEVEQRDGALRIAFPLTYTPRYQLGATIEEPAPTAVFAPAQRAGAPRARIRVVIDAGATLAEVTSSSHELAIVNEGPMVIVEPAAGVVPADRDFCLKWRPQRAAAPRPAVFVEERDGARYALVQILPPAPDSTAAAGKPTETVFVLDRSGSMDGPSIVQARAALLAALGRLRPDDRFTLICFNDGFEVFSPGFEDATPELIQMAQQWVREVRASGGTEVLAALSAAMRLAAQGSVARDQRIVLVTDAAVENHAALFAAVRAELGRTRLHVLGIGPAPNRPLVRRLAEMGGGVAEFVGGPADVEAALDGFLTRIERPVATDLLLTWDSLTPEEVYPSRIPDLHEGRPVFVSMKLAPGQSALRGRLSGWCGGKQVEWPVDVRPSDQVGAGVGARWARARIDALLADLAEGKSEDTVRAAVIPVAKQFHLVTPYTSFVAVEERPSVTAPGATVNVPSACPAGSTLCAEGWPQTGTLDPLFRALGLAFMIAGGLLVLLALRRRIAA